jgi:hypothetical protein
MITFSRYGLALVLSAAFLADCGASDVQGPANGLPDSASAARITVHDAGHLSAVKLLELQVAGKLPGPALHGALTILLDEIKRGAGRRLISRNGGSPAIWVTDPSEDYLVGQNSKGNKTVAAIDLKNLFSYPVYYPITVKVDHSQNIWVTNEYNGGGNGGDVFELSSTGTLESSYEWSYCGYVAPRCTGYGFDSAVTATKLFVAAAYYTNTVGSQTDDGTGFAVFGIGCPYCGSKFIRIGSTALGTYCSPVCSVYYTDSDPSGNVWFDFEGYNGSVYGAGLGEISNTGSSPTVSIVLPAGTYGFAGGVYVSDGGQTLNVTDQNSRTTYQYHLPVMPSSTPFHQLGPTKANYIGFGDPVSGGFNKSESNIAFGDADDWVDMGAVHSNKWKAVLSQSFQSPMGAAFTPSDK